MVFFSEWNAANDLQKQHLDVISATPLCNACLLCNITNATHCMNSSLSPLRLWTLWHEQGSKDGAKTTLQLSKQCSSHRIFIFPEWNSSIIHAFRSDATYSYLQTYSIGAMKHLDSWQLIGHSQIMYLCFVVCIISTHAHTKCTCMVLSIESSNCLMS